MSITKKEYRQMVRWVLIGVGTFFIYFYLKEKIVEIFPTKEVQLAIGIILLLIAAKYYNLNKYSG